MPVDFGMCPCTPHAPWCGVPQRRPTRIHVTHVSFMGVSRRECAHILTVVFLSRMDRTSTDSHSPPVRLSGMQRFMREGPWIRSASLKMRMGVTVTVSHAHLVFVTLLHLERCFPCSPCPRTVCLSVSWHGHVGIAPMVGTCHTALVLHVCSGIHTLSVRSGS